MENSVILFSFQRHCQNDPLTADVKCSRMDEVDAPLVFHCNACRSIVADSWSFVVANEAEQWLCTSSALSATSVCAQHATRTPLPLPLPFPFAAAAAPRLLPLRMGPRLCRCRAAIAAACSRTLHHISPRRSLSLALWFFDTAARSVRLAEELETAQSGTEAGSTSRRMHCVQCDAALGRVFVTTTSDMDRFRDNFTFDTDSLGSYKV